MWGFFFSPTCTLPPQPYIDFYPATFRQIPGDRAAPPDEYTAMRDELKLAMEAARSAGALTLKYYQGHYEISDKGHDNPVTTADLEADAHLKEMLLGTYPDYGWLSEETADNPARLERETVWIVDPIDGTKGFLRLDQYAVALALIEDGEVVLGVLGCPNLPDASGGRGRRFCAESSVRLLDGSRLTPTNAIQAGEMHYHEGGSSPYHAHIGTTANPDGAAPVSYTHLRAHEPREDRVWRRGGG